MIRIYTALHLFFYREYSVTDSVRYNMITVRPFDLSLLLLPPVGHTVAHGSVALSRFFSSGSSEPTASIEA